MLSNALVTSGGALVSSSGALVSSSTPLFTASDLPCAMQWGNMGQLFVCSSSDVVQYGLPQAMAPGLDVLFEEFWGGLRIF